MVLSKFEKLPPEFIVEISDYLDACDLYDAFYNLIGRIDTKLDTQCHRLHVNLIDISKSKFNLYCHRILPFISPRIISLSLGGNDSSTPGQLTLFLSRFHSLETMFTKLESLKVIHYTKFDVEILLPYLPRLVHLKCFSIGDFTRLTPFAVFHDDLFNDDVSLPISLRSLSFPYEISKDWTGTSSRTVSFVQQLHVHIIHMGTLISFFHYFPYLQRLTAIPTNVNQHETEEMKLCQPTLFSHTLRYLNVNLTQNVSFSDFALLLRGLPQLHSLSLEALNPDLLFFQAQSWESVLSTDLISFRFDLTMTLPTDLDHVKLLAAFKSEFWFSRGWFAECRLRNYERFFRLSTVKSPIITILYWPDDETFVGSPVTTVYSKVKHMKLWWNLSKPTRSLCPNLQSIHLYNGTQEDDDEPIHLNVHQLLCCSSLEQIIIDEDLPISPARLGSVLAASADNVCALRCPMNWILSLLEYPFYNWVSLLLTMRIRKLTIDDNESIGTFFNLISLCRTFINVQEITITVSTADILLFLLNTLRQLTMAKITLPFDALDHIHDITHWIEQNTSLTDFLAQKMIAGLFEIKLLLWINPQPTFKSVKTLMNTSSYFKNVSMDESVVGCWL